MAYEIHCAKKVKAPLADLREELRNELLIRGLEISSSDAHSFLFKVPPFTGFNFEIFAAASYMKIDFKENDEYIDMTYSVSFLLCRIVVSAITLIAFLAWSLSNGLPTAPFIFILIGVWIFLYFLNIVIAGCRIGDLINSICLKVEERSKTLK